MVTFIILVGHPSDGLPESLPVLREVVSADQSQGEGASLVAFQQKGCNDCDGASGPPSDSGAIHGSGRPRESTRTRPFSAMVVVTVCRLGLRKTILRSCRGFGSSPSGSALATEAISMIFMDPSAFRMT